MSNTSSSVSELGEEVLHAFEGILSDNDADDEHKGSEIRMDGLYHDDQTNIGASENLAEAACPLNHELLCQQKLLNMEKNQSSSHPMQSENEVFDNSSGKNASENCIFLLEHVPLCQLKSSNHMDKNKSDLHPIQSDNEVLDFSSDDSLYDPNYQGISDSNSSTSTPAVKKVKKNVSKNNVKNRVNTQHDNIPSTILLSPIATAIQVELSTLVNATSAIENTPPSRKRKKNIAGWKRNVRNVNRQKGKSYVDVNGILRPARSVKQIECSCIFRCSNSFDAVERQNIHDAFWKLDDKSKNFYYAQFVKKIPAKRKSKKDPIKKREFTFNYFLNYEERQARVCKQFFLNTLDISSRRLQWFFSKKFDETTGIPFSPAKGKHIKNKTQDTKIEEIKQHINSFPRVESHYCRENTKKEYLGSNLSVQKMYNLYKESCDGTPVKKHIYSKVFNEEFNCAFHLPKKDQCDQCSLFKDKVDLDEAEQLKFFNHEKNKAYAKHERDNDRKNTDGNTAVITYDLENVFALPKAEISSFYYTRKSAVYNLTGHCNLNRVTYCNIWTEAQSGRAGNDLASALYKILNAVVQDLPMVNKIILWSDSCVAQNKNRVNTTMILKFLQDNSRIDCIIHKYSEPGHTQLQEVDSVHSAIVRHLRGITIYSPVTLLKQLTKLNYEKVHLRIMQMKDVDFFNFNLASKIFPKMVPFMQARLIKYESNDLNTLGYKTNLSETEQYVNTILNKNFRNRFPKIVVKPLVFNWIVSDEKIKDIKSMLKYMEKIDVEYYKL